MAMRVATTPIGLTRDRTATVGRRYVTPRPTPLGPPAIRIAGTTVHLTDAPGACAVIASAVKTRDAAPLGVVSVNLDHIHHERALDLPAGSARWLNLIDGAPVATEARRLTGTPWERLAGSDLIVDILTLASHERWRVAVLGGSSETRTALHHSVTTQWPGVRLIGHWTPSRAELDSAEGSKTIAAQMRAAGVDLVIVCLGKPRQEQWIAQHGRETGAGALLAFGAVVDFLAGRVSRAPHWVSGAGLEWMWRLMLEPKRLAKRYLVEGPPAYLAVRRSSVHREA